MATTAVKLRYRRAAWVLLLSVAVIAVCRPAAPIFGRPEGADPTGNDQPLTVGLTASKEAFRVLEPVELTVEVKDAEGCCVQIIESVTEYRKVQFIVTDKDGVTTPMTRFGRTIGSIDNGFKYNRTGASGVRLKVQLPVNLLHDMTIPGEYMIVGCVPYGEVRRGAKQDSRRVATSRPLRVRIERP